MPVVTLDRVSMAYGHRPLLDDASLQVEPGERVCVIGRNGTGKSTLLRLIHGDEAPLAGTVWPGRSGVRPDCASAGSRRMPRWPGTVWSPTL
jgi:ATPase subunit of ABC transporter with duplicated ATPase domains